MVQARGYPQYEHFALCYDDVWDVRRLFRSAHSLPFVNNPQVNSEGSLVLQEVAANRSEGVDVPGSLWEISAGNESVRTSQFASYDSDNLSHESSAGKRVDNLSSGMGNLASPENRLESSSISPQEGMNRVVIENQGSDQTLEFQATNSQMMNSESVPMSSDLSAGLRFTHLYKNQSME